LLVATPELSRSNAAQLERIWLLQRELAPSLNEPKVWTGTLRRQALGRAIKYSVGIEGYVASEAESSEVVLSKESSSLPEGTVTAISGYRQAMGLVLAQATRGDFELDQTFIKALHFMTLSGNQGLEAGNYRSRAIFVRDDSSGEVVHEGADFLEVPHLMRELTARYRSPGNELSIVSAAMAHLNMVLIHPFADGNGRVARILQSAILAGEEKPSPLFLSIEEYLGRHTQSYYDILAKVGGGSWNPGVDASPWLDYVLGAHEAQLDYTRNHWQKLNKTWSAIAQLVGEMQLSDRVVPALVHVASGQRLTNNIYRQLLVEAGDGVSLLTASRDLALLSERGLLSPSGENRARHYASGSLLRAALEG
jgi:Fic family protein